jgi:hypothetical protein
MTAAVIQQLATAPVFSLAALTERAEGRENALGLGGEGGGECLNKYLMRQRNTRISRRHPDHTTVLPRGLFGPPCAGCHGEGGGQ